VHKPNSKNANSQASLLLFGGDYYFYWDEQANDLDRPNQIAPAGSVSEEVYNTHGVGDTDCLD